MRHLGLALIAEGPTDERFLSPLLRRATIEACGQVCRGEVETGDVFLVGRLRGAPGKRLQKHIAQLVESASGSAAIVFVHTDGSSDPDRARSERFEPADHLLIARQGLPRSVAVIPVRETEAWAIADRDALRSAFGTDLADEDLGLSFARPSDVERLGDPKQAFEDALKRVIGQRFSRKRHQPAQYLDVLGERVSLPILRQVPAFRRFEADLKAVLQDLC